MTSSFERRASRAAIGVLLAALAFVPLIASEHRYAHALGDSSTCATCVVVLHAPTVVVSPAVTPAPALLVEGVAPVVLQVAAPAPATIRSGRAPPAPRALAV